MDDVSPAMAWALVGSLDRMVTYELIVIIFREKALAKLAMPLGRAIRFGEIVSYQLRACAFASENACENVVYQVASTTGSGVFCMAMTYVRTALFALKESASC